MEIMTYGDAYQIIEEFPQSLLLRYERCLKGKKRGSDFVFDFVSLLYYNYCISFKRCGSYIDSADWLKKKKSYHKSNKSNIRGQLRLIMKNLQRITKLCSSINKRNWCGINILSKKVVWVKFEKANWTWDLIWKRKGNMSNLCFTT